LSNLDIEAHHSLTDDGFAIGGYVYDTNTPKIGEGSGYYTTNCNALQTLRIVDTPINGYNIVKHALNLKKYYFQDIAWHITNITDADNQYCIVPKDKELDETVTYYIYDGENNTYVAWDKEQNPTRPTVLYQYIKILDDKQENIINIPVLDYLATLTPLDVNSHADALSGTLTINVANVGADEYAIYSKYIAIYPKLKIVFDDSMSENITRANNI
jgi:hypothetical protein